MRILEGSKGTLVEIRPEDYRRQNRPGNYASPDRFRDGDEVTPQGYLPDTEGPFERRLSRKAKRRRLFFARNIDILVHRRRLTRFFMMVVGGRGLLRITS